jgi:phasin family protein
MTKSTPTDQTNPFGDLTKMFEQFKLPGVDMGAIVESRRKEMEALIATNQATLESMQGIARKQAEILAQAFKSVQDGMQTLVQGGGLSAPDPAKGAEMARKAYEKAVAEMSELGEMARKAQADAMAGITARAQQSMQELQQLMQPKK